MKYDFDTVSANLPLLLRDAAGDDGAGVRAVSGGFGIKMGMWPFGQFWLPDAHPAAPSPVSAMLSGVMIKTGVYGVMRYFLWLVPAERAGELSAGAVGYAGCDSGHDHFIHGNDAGDEAGANETAARVPQHWAGWIHSAGDGGVHGAVGGEHAGGGAGDDCTLRGVISCAEPRAVQGAAVFECGIDAARDGTQI